VPPATSYLFLELAMVVFFVGFCWEHIRSVGLTTWRFWRPALLLAAFWLVLDQIAVSLRIWAFPASGTLPIRILHLPVEEYILFLAHTLICILLLRLYKAGWE
jgi:lycopene cyclase domain-containing protein